MKSLFELIFLLKKGKKISKHFFFYKKGNDLENNFILAVAFELIASFRKSICEIYGTISYISLRKTTLFFLSFIEEENLSLALLMYLSF